MRISWLRFFFLMIGILAPPVYWPRRRPAAFQGSASAGPASDQPLSLSLDDALKMGLRYNLGGITAEQSSQRATGENIVARSLLFPNLSGGARENVEQIDLASFGFKFQVSAEPGHFYSEYRRAVQLLRSARLPDATRCRFAGDPHLSIFSRSATRSGTFRGGRARNRGLRGYRRHTCKCWPNPRAWIRPRCRWRARRRFTSRPRIASPPA